MRETERERVGTGLSRKIERAQRNFLLASSLAFFHMMKPTPKHT